MNNLKVEKLMSELKISKSFANVIRYTRFVETGKIYTNQGWNASSIIKYLEKNFGVTFENGNDAPKGGKWGNFVQVIETDQYKDFIIQVLELNHLANVKAESIENERKLAIENFEIDEKMKAEFIKKTEGLNNTQSRNIANNMIGRKLGFYSSTLRNKLMELR